MKTVVQDLGEFRGNHLYMKRDDLLPFSFGGNKARKAVLFFQEVDEGGYDSVVTYGSGSSNHCRIVANMCAARNISCHVIAPLEASEPTFNSQLINMFGAETTTVPVAEVHDTIEAKLEELRQAGKKPYFIYGGGHGNIGTEAYVRCYREIREWEREEGIHLDYIFFASGTGTTHAGLVCGQMLAGEQNSREIIGISISRPNPKGRTKVLASIKDYMGDRATDEEIEAATVFLDDYRAGGYAKSSPEIVATVDYVLKNYGIPLDETYTGKAFTGMDKYLAEKGIQGKNVLFIHTGGTPLFFDGLKKRESAE